MSPFGALTMIEGLDIAISGPGDAWAGAGLGGG